MAALSVGGAIEALAAAAARKPGFALGFASLRKETRLPDLPVEGRMPRWLTGTLLGNGTALFEVGPDRFNHWFDGLAMLHAFSSSAAACPTPTAYLRSSAYTAWNRDGRIRYSEFGTDPCRKIFSGVSTLPVLGRVPNANVSIERLGRQLVAHTEIPVPVRFNPGPCKDARASTRSSNRPARDRSPAHDPRTGERFSYEIELVPPSGLRILGARGGEHRELAWIPKSAPGYLHSFALTPRNVAIFTQPCKFDLPRFLGPDRGPIVTNYAWDGSKPSRIVLIDRERGGMPAPLSSSRGSSSITSTPLSGRARSCSTSALTVTRRWSTRCTSSGCAHGREVPRAGPPAARGRARERAHRAARSARTETRAAARRLPTRQRAALPLCLRDRLKSARAGSSTGSSRSTSSAERPTVARSRLLSRASRCSSVAQARAARTTACCSRSCSTAASDVRSWSCWMRAKWRRSRGPRSRSIPFGFHGTYAV